MKRIALEIFSILICGMVSIVGCSKQDLDLEGFENIIGCWTNSIYEDNGEGKFIVSYERAKTLPANSAGIKFLKDGTLIECKNAGWCGTPPITYANYSGKWQVDNDDKIKIDVVYWGGIEYRIIRIIDVTNTTLKIEIVSWETNDDATK